MMKKKFATIEEAIQTLQAGRMIILVDSEARENEGDLVIAAQFATPEAINFMSRQGGGLVCLPLAGTWADKLQLPMMTTRNTSRYGTPFTVSIEATNGVTTGVSAADKACTIRVAASLETTAEDLISPGHIFPLRAAHHGVLARAGHTEGSIDLMRLAGLNPVAAIAEIMNADGSMSRRDELFAFSEQHDIPLVAITDLIDYRIRHETLVIAQAESSLPIEGHGDFTITVFSNTLDDKEHFVLSKPVMHDAPPLVRIHSECITGDLFHSTRCDCGEQLERSLALIGKEGGYLIYLRQEGRGIGLTNKIKAYALQSAGLDTVEANLQLGFLTDQRSFAIAYQLLKHFGVSRVRLLTNNPEKINALATYGIEVVERSPLAVHPTGENQRYLRTKKEKMGHLLPMESYETD
jgi:3,4-dihydroxy 2-butanone 4-phosphate synthase/GTP cyclohydrolase II